MLAGIQSFQGPNLFVEYQGEFLESLKLANLPLNRRHGNKKLKVMKDPPLEDSLLTGKTKMQKESILVFQNIEKTYKYYNNKKETVVKLIELIVT
jgi:hypothetical protein